MTIKWDNGIRWVQPDPTEDECDICGFHAKHNNGVIILCADGIFRCKVCRGEGKFQWTPASQQPKPEVEVTP